MAEHPEWIAYLVFLADLGIRIGLSLRILMRGTTVGVTFAWMTIVLALPYLGALLYLLIGERRLGGKRTGRATRIIEQTRGWRNAVCETFPHASLEIPPQYRSFDIQARKVIGYPATPDNSLELLTDYQTIFHRLIEDVEAATRRISMEFYIWQSGGLADELLDALIRAHDRGVEVRLLLDSVGSGGFLRGKRVSSLRQHGLKIVEALHVNAVKALFQRADIRNHRKIVVIDNRIAYTGSQNIVDPRFFKQEAGVGEWIDVMIRVQGPGVSILGNVIAMDWSVEADEVDRFSATDVNTAVHGDIEMQVVPSGPVFREGAIHELLMSVIYRAQYELIISTPYFAPDDALTQALIAAANRGVKVTLILPARNDSFLVRHAMPALLDILLAAGIRVAKFDAGLLHTKSVTVDGDFAIVGSVNLDMRSLWLNFEISLFIYDYAFTQQVRNLQLEYLTQSRFIDSLHYRQRSYKQRLAANVMRLFAPVL